MKWYLAYGSNMNAARLIDERLRRGGVAHRPQRIGGRLEGWQLAFNKQRREPVGAGAGNIVRAATGVVYGTLNALPTRGFEILDHWEGVAAGHYERRTVPVVRADIGETVAAIAYVALRVGDGLLPTRAYLAHLLAGRDLLPADYWEKLRATPTLD